MGSPFVFVLLVRVVGNNYYGYHRLILVLHVPGQCSMYVGCDLCIIIGGSEYTNYCGTMK